MNDCIVNSDRDKLAQCVRCFPHWPTAKQARDLIDSRVKLAKQITQFDVESPIDDEDIPLHPETDQAAEEEESTTSSVDEDESDSEDEAEHVDLDWEAAEKTMVPLPSRFEAVLMCEKGFEHLLMLEKELREAQMKTK